MKRKVGIGVFVEVLRWRGMLELEEQRAQFRDFPIRRVQRREACRHALERGPHLDHLDDLALRLAYDENATPRNGAQKALLLQ